MGERRSRDVALRRPGRAAADVDDEPVGADLEAVGILRAPVLEPPGADRRVPGIEPVGDGAERLAEQALELPDGIGGGGDELL